MSVDESFSSLPHTDQSFSSLPPRKPILKTEAILIVVFILAGFAIIAALFYTAVSSLMNEPAPIEQPAPVEQVDPPREPSTYDQGKRVGEALKDTGEEIKDFSRGVVDGSGLSDFRMSNFTVATSVVDPYFLPDVTALDKRRVALEQEHHQAEVKASQAAQAKFVESRRAELKAKAEAEARAQAEAQAAAFSFIQERQSYIQPHNAPVDQWDSVNNYSSPAPANNSWVINSYGDYDGSQAQAAVDANDIVLTHWGGRNIYAGHSTGSAGQFSNFKAGDTVAVNGQGTFRITDTVSVPRGSYYDDVPEGTAFQTCENGMLVLRYAEKVG